MKASMQMRFSQQLTLTPQLQQAIRLLQLSTTELQQEIQQALETNPMLELADEQFETAQEHDVNNDQAIADATSDTLFDTASDTSGMDYNEHDLAYADIPKELSAVDTVWEDIYNDFTPTKSSSSSLDNPWDWQQSNQEVSLHEHLIWQVQVAHFSPAEEAIAMTIVDGIGNDGLLEISLADVHEGVKNNGWQVEEEQIEKVLRQIQSFEPIGVGARDLRECLLIQLQHLPLETPWLEQALAIVDQSLGSLAAHDYNTLMRRHHLNQTQLREVIMLIQELEPRPGTKYSCKPISYITPDVIVKKKNDRWVVELNPETLPKLRINQYYAGLIQNTNRKVDSTFLRQHMQEARWFLKSLQSRHETLLKVATCIVEHQKDFLEQGEQAMKPLVLRDVADILGMHESTISRVTTQKYLHTPFGIFELKYFFSSHVGTIGTTSECSSTAIRAHIKTLINAENPKQPLSDNAIANLLKQQGIEVARRTIAKYREAMTIPPSHQRKSLI